MKRILSAALMMLVPIFIPACAIESSGNIFPEDGDDGSGGSECTDDCAVGERDCQGIGFVVCGEFDDDDCLDWSEPIECASDKVCEGGECLMACTDQCQAGERQCAGDGYQECGNHDSDSCLEWSEVTACGADQVCQADTVTCVDTYPAGPYGTGFGDTIENLCLERCVCTSGSPQAESFCLDEFLGNKAILIGVHTGWCPGCREMAAQLEDGLYQPYHDQGFEIVLVLIEDDGRSSNRSALLSYCCEEKNNNGMTFTVAIDPGGQKTSKFFSWGALPLSMVVDSEMTISYKSEGSAYGLEAKIQDLLSGP